MSCAITLRVLVVAFVACLLPACGDDGNDAPPPASVPPLIAVSAGKATVQTVKGGVIGTLNATTISFLGIPYGLAPTGTRRWQPPVEAAAWATPLDVSGFGKHCYQQGSAPTAQPNASEDCLNVSVYVPTALGAANPGAARAVMVWIYGGANAVGASDSYDPTPLVSAEDVVVVTFNYRVGSLGFLAHSALDAEGHAFANYGVLDQQLALRWIRDNIAAFGGDKTNITIFGESAGGLNVTTHLVSPGSAGLFSKAIIESGAYQLDTPSLAASEAAGTAFATRLGCTSQTADCLRSKSVTDLLAQEGAVNTATSAFNQSTVDGTVLPASQRMLLSAGRINRAPVISGANGHEGRVFEPQTLTLAAYQATVTTFGSSRGHTAAESLATYPITDYASPFEAASAALGDFAFACTSRNVNQLLASFTTVYGYEFDDPNASDLGASHGAEIVYLMNTPGSNATRGANGTGDSLTLSRTMRRYWAQFARTGNPNATNVPTWTPFTTVTDNVQYLVPPTPRQDTGLLSRHKCAFWG